MLSEIEVSKLLQGELLKIDPSLASASSFLNTVCARETKEKKVKKQGDAEIRVKGSALEIMAVPTKVQMSARVLEQQRLTRILVSKTMLEEELAKDVPSAVIVSILEMAVGDRGEPTAIVMREKETVLCAMISNPILALTPMIITSEVRAEPAQGVETRMEEGGGEVSDDAAMSIGDSDEEEDGSDGFSRSGSSSSREESTQSRRSRKRPADESPEPDPSEMNRREFPR